MTNSANKPNWKKKVESQFSALGLMIGKHPWFWLLTCVLLIGATASQLVHIRQDTTIEGFLEPGSPELVKYDYFKNTFGRDELFLVSVETDDIHDPEFIKTFREFHERIEDEVPHVKSVESLANGRHTYGEDDTLYIEDLLPEELPTDPDALQRLKDYTFGNPNYVDFLISRDNKLLVLLVKLVPFIIETDENGQQTQRYLDETDLETSLDAMYKLSNEYRGVLSDDIQLSGTLPISILLTKIMTSDFSLFSSLANLLIGIVLFIIFRRLSGVFMPLIIMGLGVTLTLSLMAIFDTPLQVSTSILPSFLLAVCVGDSIHLLTIFYREYDKGAEKTDALAYAMGHSGLAIFFTSITTAAGLASFATSELTPIAALGIYGALGSLIAFLLTVLILPCLIAVLPLKRRPLVADNDTAMDRLLQKFANIAIEHPVKIAVTGAALFIITLGIASQSNFSHHPPEWLPKDSPEYLAMKHHEERMGTTLAIEVMLDTGKDRGAIEPEFLRALDALQQDVEQWTAENYSITKTASVVNILKETNRALHDNDEAYYSVPDSRELVSQELFLVEMDEPDDLYNVVDRRLQTARLTVLLPWVDALYVRELLKRFQPAVEKYMGAHTSDITITGLTPILGATFAKMLFSTAESYGIAAITITLMMIMLIGSIKLGLLSMIPSLLPILIVLSIIRLSGIPLDMLTMLVGSIAIGLTVDDNVHFMHGFRRQFRVHGNRAQAIRETLATSGRAMLITSIVLSIGFIIYTQSAMSNMINFGLMTALCITLALLASFLLAPALMMIFNKDTDQPSQPTS